MTFATSQQADVRHASFQGRAPEAGTPDVQDRRMTETAGQVVFHRMAGALASWPHRATTHHTLPDAGAPTNKDSQ